MAGVRAQTETGLNPNPLQNPMWAQTAPFWSNAPIADSQGNLMSRSGDGTYVPFIAPNSSPALPGSLQSLARAGGVPTTTMGYAGGMTPQQAAANTQMAADTARAANQNDALRTSISANGMTDPQMAARQAVADEAARTQQQQGFQTQTAATANANATTAQERMFALIKPYLDQMMTTSNQPAVVPPDDVSAHAAQDAAFARAKDRTADLARSSLTALRQSAAQRGVNVAGGSNPALLATEGRLMSESAKPLSDLVSQQTQDEVTRAQQVADRNYQGAITQAGQRAALAPSLLSLLRVGGLY